jgi:hypothetical protein
MASHNDITGDRIATKNITDAYRNNYDLIFGKKKVNQETECKKCPGCDRKECDQQQQKKD